MMIPLSEFKNFIFNPRLNNSEHDKSNSMFILHTDVYPRTSAEAQPIACIVRGCSQVVWVSALVAMRDSPLMHKSNIEHVLQG
jgi:hypothetical protein